MIHKKSKKFIKLFKKLPKELQIAAREVFEDFKSNYPNNLHYLKRKYRYKKLNNIKTPTFSIDIPNKEGGRAVHEIDKDDNFIWKYITDNHDDYEIYAKSLQ